MNKVTKEFNFNVPLPPESEKIIAQWREEKKKEKRKKEKAWARVRIVLKFAENAEKKIWIKLLNNKYFYENLNLNFSLQNKKLQKNKPFKDSMKENCKICLFWNENLLLIIWEMKKNWNLEFLILKRKV